MSSHLDSAASVFHHHNHSHSHHHTTSSSTAKRKLDDYATSADDDLVWLISSRMRKDQSNPLSSSNYHQQHHHQQQRLPLLPLSLSLAESTSSSTRLQFFVRTISHNTLVLHADRYDTVKSVHQKILSITGIPIIEQRLIYRGKQLQWEQTLAECDVENDAGLQLVGRMRSTDHPQAWQLIEDMVTKVLHLCRGNSNDSYSITELTRQNNSVIKSRLTEFLNMIPRGDTEQTSGHLQIFLSSKATTVLVMLYMSSIRDNRRTADEAIRHFITTTKNRFPEHIHMQCTPIVLEFCKFLSRAAGSADPLYIFCRSSLGSMVEHVSFREGQDGGGGNKNINGLIDVREIFQFVSELALKLAQDLELSTGSATFVGPSLSDVRDFIAFVIVVRNAVEMQVSTPIMLPLPKGSSCGGYNTLSYGEEIEFLHKIFVDLLEKMDMCLKKMEEHLAVAEKGKVEQLMLGWSQYLTILKELNSISKLYQGGGEMFWALLRQRKVSLCHLIVRFAKRVDDHRWILDHKEVTNFEARRHLVMMMLPDVKDEYEELHEMLIDRSQLLAVSFEYIARAEPEALRSGLFMEFKNEEATGPGVLREWFFLVCQAIFNQQNALFVACPNDRRRFFPNPASKVDPLHLEYFSFSGRVIALALIHKVQVGIVFDRVFFVQLAGKVVSLEDIRDADPYLYSSCKQILEMDPEIVDQDALGLTFVREVEELGSRKIVELCQDGRSITVTSSNREQYVDLLIKHRFVTSIAEQVAHFAQGFADIIGSPVLQRSFFQSLDLEDFDWILHGSESAISVEDWKVHTEYNGFKETDPQILWFWKVIWILAKEMYTSNVSRIYDVVNDLLRIQLDDRGLQVYFGRFRRAMFEYNDIFLTDTDVARKQREQYFVVLMLHGLPPQYESVRSQILSGPELPLMSEVYSRLDRASIGNPVQNPSNQSALLVQPQPGGHQDNASRHGHGCGGGRNRGGGRSGNASQPQCTYCNKLGHTKDKCWDLHGRTFNSANAAFVNNEESSLRASPPQQANSSYPIFTLSEAEYKHYLQLQAL